MKQTLIVLAIFAISVTNSFAQHDGALTKNDLQEIKKNAKLENAEYLINAISNNEIKSMVINRENLSHIDKNFSNRIKIKGITDQQRSGRCWLFTGLNVLREQVIEDYNMPSFQFSQNYNFFFDQLEKSNLFLEGIIETKDLAMDDKKVEFFIKHPINDGGQWTTFSNNVKKYGVVPSDVMPETYHSNHTVEVSKLIKTRLRKGALEIRKIKNLNITSIRDKKKQILADIYRILVLTMGEPPTEFTWRYKDENDSLISAKKYTPITFRDEFVKINFDDYVMLMNDPTREFEKLFEIEYDRSLAEGDNWKYINLDADKIKEFAKNSIIAGEAMYFSCDVGKFLNKNNGTLDTENFNYDALLGVDFSMTKEERISVYESGSSHGMALVAFDYAEDGKSVDKWLLENSWGSSAGWEGFLIMTDQWFDEYMFRLIVHKKHIDKETLKILDTEPTILPPWDPMYSGKSYDIE